MTICHSKWDTPKYTFIMYVEEHPVSDCIFQYETSNYAIFLFIKKIIKSIKILIEIENT